MPKAMQEKTESSVQRSTLARRSLMSVLPTFKYHARNQRKSRLLLLSSSVRSSGSRSRTYWRAPIEHEVAKTGVSPDALFQATNRRCEKDHLEVQGKYSPNTFTPRDLGGM